MSTPEVWRPKGIVGILDTSVLVTARLARVGSLSPSREIMHLAGTGYDSFTGPGILAEVENVLARTRFGIPIAETRRWVDAFLRSSRQVDPTRVPGDYQAAVGGDFKDSHILQTALAVYDHPDGQIAVEYAREMAGCYIVSLDHHFETGRNVWGLDLQPPRRFFRGSSITHLKTLGLSYNRSYIAFARNLAKDG